MSHTYVQLTYHTVFSTSGRRALISDRVRPKLHAYMGGAVNKSFGRIRRVGGTVDHVHLLLDLHQSNAVADCLRVIKANSSAWVHETFPDLRDFARQEGYGAFLVSASAIPRVATYVETQEEHHRACSFRDEFIALLERHGVEYDETYLWR